MPTRSTRNREQTEAGLRKRFGRIRKKLLLWFRVHDRAYPWRQTQNWFHLLMAEMMLRRTRADQVVPVYRDFVRDFPTPRHALLLPAKELEKRFRSLGMHWRGRQLRSTISYLHDHFAARQPAADSDFEEIPGVGPYSSAMLQSRLFRKRVAAVDANVARFIARLVGLAHHAESRRDREVVCLANRFVNSPRAADLNLAMIDFSALVCKARTPLCAGCPLRSDCASGQISPERMSRSGPDNTSRSAGREGNAPASMSGHSIVTSTERPRVRRTPGARRKPESKCRGST